MLLIKDNDETYRVRKEEVGCSIFGPSIYAEGDDILFEILNAFNELGVEKGILELENHFDADSNEIRKDLLELADNFLSNNILKSLANEIKLQVSKEIELYEIS